MNMGLEKGRKRRIIGCILGLVIGSLMPIVAQSPANLLSDVNASNGFATVTATEATYNNARRQEESQLGLPANSIQNLNLPSQVEWNSYSEDKKALFIINDERTSRAGINYGQGPVLGLAFEGVAQKIDQVSQTYAQVLMDQDAFTHTHGGTSPSTRITGTVGANCKEFTARSENLYGAVSSANSGFTDVVEKAMYGFIYDDAGSNWGHREMCLLQNNDLAGRPWGFTNNHGDSDTEGFIGIGIVRGTNWSAFGSNWAYGVVLVLNYFDPVPSACTYNITEATDGTIIAPPDNVAEESECASSLSLAQEDVEGIHMSATTITLGANVQITGPTIFSAPNVIINGPLDVLAGACFDIVSDGCAFVGEISCAPASVAGNGQGTCTQPHALTCGTSLNGNTANGSNVWSNYGQAGWTGPEEVFTLVQPAGQTFILRLEDLQADLDLIIIQPCTNTPLLGSTNSGTSDEVLSIAAVATTRTLYFVVDGFGGASSSFKISLTCGNSAKEEVDLSLKSKASLSKKLQQLEKFCQPYLESK